MRSLFQIAYDFIFLSREKYIEIDSYKKIYKDIVTTEYLAVLLEFYEFKLLIGNSNIFDLDIVHETLIEQIYDTTNTFLLSTLKVNDKFEMAGCYVLAIEDGSWVELVDMSMTTRIRLPMSDKCTILCDTTMRFFPEPFPGYAVRWSNLRIRSTKEDIKILSFTGTPYYWPTICWAQRFIVEQGTISVC